MCLHPDTPLRCRAQSNAAPGAAMSRVTLVGSLIPVEDDSVEGFAANYAERHAGSKGVDATSDDDLYYRLDVSKALFVGGYSGAVRPTLHIPPVPPRQRSPCRFSPIVTIRTLRPGGHFGWSMNGVEPVLKAAPLAPHVRRRLTTCAHLGCPSVHRTPIHLLQARHATLTLNLISPRAG